MREDCRCGSLFGLRRLGATALMMWMAGAGCAGADGAPPGTTPGGSGSSGNTAVAGMQGGQAGQGQGTPSAGQGAAPGNGSSSGAGQGPGSTPNAGDGGGAQSGNGASGSSGSSGNGASGMDGSAGGSGGEPIPQPGMIDMVGNANRAPGFIDLSPPMGEPLPMQGDSVTPAPPSGWSWYGVAGTRCRDGSPAGLYLRRGTANKVLIYLEGGGACSNLNYCSFNPASVDQVLAGDGQVVLGSALGAGPGRQQPGAYTDASHVGPPAGVFDTSNMQNPFREWSQVYIPYCTGDVHFGTKEGGTVPGLTQPQQFVGYTNMQRFIGRIVPTFPDATQVVLTGASAGGFGAALNYSMVQDAFGDVPVLAISDSGPPFKDQFMPPCMQRLWREAWGFNGSLPPDCEECRQEDGAGLLGLADFLLRKHPQAKIAMISSMQDEVIRLFFSVGLQNCANYDTADPVAVVLLQFDTNVFFPAEQYTGGLNDLRRTYTDTGRFATYFMGGANVVFHQHIFRPRFYEAVAGGKTIAQFVTEFVNGTVSHVGP